MGCELVDLSIISTLGTDVPSTEESIFNQSFKNHLSRTDSFLINEDCFVGQINEDLPALSNKYEELDSKFARIVQYLYNGISKTVSGLKDKFGSNRIGIVFGSSTSGMDYSEDAFIYRNQHGEFPNDFYFFNQNLAVGSSLLSYISGVTGPAYTVSTACSSSAKIFRTARGMLELDLVDAVILGGVDSLCRMTIRGFKSLDLISSKVANPMSVNRDGLNIGEGGALFVMTKSNKGIQFCGIGESSDAYHISSPEPEGRGAVAAIRGAMEEAGTDSSKVSYINLHGTGTKFNDSMEANAISRIDSLSSVPCSSTKPSTGHLLGASAAVEIGICWIILASTQSNKILPVHHFDGLVDPDLPKLNLIKNGQSYEIPDGNIILSNSFGFGGSNCCVALKFVK